MPDPQEQTDRTPWHAMELEEVLERRQADRDGLGAEQARRRLQEQGRNELEQQEQASLAGLVFKQVRSPLVYLLAAAAVLSLVVEHYADAGVIAAVVVLNTVLGVVQEWRAEKALEALRQMAAPHARVLRDGQEQEVASAEVVPGDVLVIEAGDRVAADARLIDADDLEVNESALTGESAAVNKKPGQFERDTALADRENMVWSNTAVTAGRGKALVVETGMASEMGQIAGQVRGTEREETPLQKRLARFGKYLGIVAVVLSAGLFGLGMLRGYELTRMLLFSVAMAVSAIPAGLPAAISITLALGVQRMAREHAIVRRLPAVETLGSTTVICSDKTGTITQNQMTVTRLWLGGTVYEVEGEGYEPEGAIAPHEDPATRWQDDPDALPAGLRRLVQIGLLANNAQLTQEQSEEGDAVWDIEGDPTEGALVVLAAKAGYDPAEYRRQRDRLDEVPFSSDRKYMATLHRAEDGDGRLLCVKGAPDTVLEFCRQALNADGETTELDEAARERIRQANQAFARQALRVMAAGYRPLDAGRDEIADEDPESGLTFAGLWGMVDPARPEAIEAIEQAQKAGIRVVMLTGDHAVTASAIARKAGIAGEGDEALTGPEIEQMDNETVAERALSTGVFARVSPGHKVKILQALKARDEIVAMTGDGVNDAPALKGADIGVAMGRSGTEVAKEAADMILTDDDFATIVHAVQEGRVIFNNLRNVVFFLITTSASEILTLASAVMLGLDLPLTAIMILWVNLVSDGAADIPLGVEPKHFDVLSQPPRPPDTQIVDGPMLRRVLLLAPFVAAGTLGLFWYAQQRGHDLVYSQTVAFTTLAAFQWFQGLNARSRYSSVFKIGLFSNRWIILGIGVAIALQLGILYIPWFNKVMSTAPLTGFDWLLIVPVASTILIADEIYKRLGIHGQPRKGQPKSENPRPAA